MVESSDSVDMPALCALVLAAGLHVCACTARGAVICMCPHMISPQKCNVTRGTLAQCPGGHESP
jgi:hypothetical protein